MTKPPASMIEALRCDVHRSHVRWLCPACGGNSNKQTGHDSCTVVDGEGFRWHRSCIVEMLPSLRKLLKRFNFDTGRTDR